LTHPASVLFACNFNRVRSPMAEAMMRGLYGDRFYVDSCGLQPEECVDPLVVQVLQEVGVDASSHVIQGFGDLDPDAFDLVIAFTPQARERAEEMARGSAVQIDFWPIEDPTLTEGSRNQVLERYRAVRDNLKARLVERFGAPVPGALQVQSKA
jgi:protein-tyrosine-phosphatase